MSLEITLRPELGQFIEEKVRSGDFDSPSDVIGSALSLLKDQEFDFIEETPELIDQIAVL